MTLKNLIQKLKKLKLIKQKIFIHLTFVLGKTNIDKYKLLKKF